MNDYYMISELSSNTNSLIITFKVACNKVYASKLCM